MKRPAALLATLAALSCLAEPAGPGLREARLLLAPRFEGSASIPFDRVRVTLTRPATDAAVVDTVVVIPASADSVDLALRVPLTAAAEEFLLYLRLINAAGDTVFRNEPYPQRITVTAGGASTAVPVTIRATVASIAVAPAIATLTALGATQAFQATALDEAGQPLTTQPVFTWSTSISSVASIDAVTGVATAVGDGTAIVTATARAVSGSSTVTVRQVATQLVFSVQPSTATSGLAITPPVGVTAQDARGNRVATFTDVVTVALGANPGGSVLLGTLAQTASAGVARFADLRLDRPGTAYTLIASSGSLPAVQSEPFAVTLSSRIVFAGDSTDGIASHSGVFQVNPDGSGRTRLSGLGSQGDVHPRSSPDRRRVAFTFNALVRSELFVVARTADTLAKLVTDTNALRPRWSPDGIRLAFECGLGSSTQEDVCVIPDVTGPLTSLGTIGDRNGRVVVTDFDADKVDGPGAFAWDPSDARTLVVVRDSLTVALEVISQLYLVLFDRTGLTRVSGPLQDPSTRLPLQIVTTLDWSADGSTIVFAARDPKVFDIANPTGQRLYLINRDGTGLRQLTRGPAMDSHPVFSPDGRQVLFLRDNGCSADYWRVVVATGLEERVSAEGWCDFSSSVLGHDWSPDGSQIVLVGSAPIGTANNRFVIYRLPAGTTALTYTSDAVLIGRGVDPNAFVIDMQPSWRP